MSIKKMYRLGVLACILALGFASCQKKADNQTETVSADSTKKAMIETKTETKTEDKSQRPSPLDSVVGKFGQSQVKIVYGRPSVKGRAIWGDLVKYDEVWRTGANEATTFELSQDANIEGKKLKAGRYALFTQPTKGEWSVIFNSVPDQWGAFKYDQKQDVLKVKVKPEMVADNQEVLAFSLDEKANKVILRWEKLKLAFEVK